MKQLTNTCIRAIYDIQQQKIIIKSDKEERLETDLEVIDRLKKITKLKRLK